MDKLEKNLFCGIFFLAGTLILFCVPFAYQERLSFRRSAFSTVGVIIKTTKDTDESFTFVPPGGVISTSSTTYYSTIRFKTEQGDVIEFQESALCSNPDLCNGRNVSILYTPDNPYSASVDRGRTPLDEVKHLIFLGTGLIGIAGYMGLRFRGLGTKWHR